MAGYTVAQLADELMELLNREDDPIFAEDHLMLDITGRWTDIKGVRIEQSGLVLLESED